MAKILVAEDDAALLALVGKYLQENGHEATLTKNGEEALAAFFEGRFDMILSDIMMPLMDGFTLAENVRREDKLIPILFMSAKDDKPSKMYAYKIGIDDYVTKPFGSAEFLARVRSILRNSRHASSEGRIPGGRFTLDGLVIDYDARRVFIDGEEIKFTQTEYNILAFLSESAGKMMSYSAIINSIWHEYSNDGNIKRLQVNMANIRKKLGLKPGDNKYIVNELGVGYRLQDNG